MFGFYMAILAAVVSCVALFVNIRILLYHKRALRELQKEVGNDE
jgi:hypothetical protein